MENSVHQFKMKKINGTEISLNDYAGKVMLIVNVASQCGLTPQYEALEKLYENYQQKGLVVLGFPANEFGAQEPGTNAEIQDFCVSKFGIKFPMFEKIVVKGQGQHPLYQHLTTKAPTAHSANGDAFETKLKGYGLVREQAQDILWNFEKFLIGKKGEILARFAPDMPPDHPDILNAINKALS